VNAALANVLSLYVDAQTPDGRAAIMRNSYHPWREIQTGVGPVMVQIPKVCSQSGKPFSCWSALVPPYVRKTKALQPLIPWCHLKHCPAVTACSDEEPRVKWSLHSRPCSVPIPPSFCRNCHPPKVGVGFRIRRVAARRPGRRRVGPLSVILKTSPAWQRMQSMCETGATNGYYRGLRARITSSVPLLSSA
jgi:hypothetical protein